MASLVKPQPSAEVKLVTPNAERIAAARSAMVRLEGVSKVFPARRGKPAVTAVEDVTLDVPAGEIHGIIGRSGAGKSTLVRLVNLLERPSEGRVLVGGVELTGLAPKALRRARRRIGMIFQHFNLLSSRTVFGNVALPLELEGLSQGEIRRTAEPLLELVGLTDKRDRYPVELSGGQKQRVGVARALATRPDVLLCDEATSALDPETTRQILKLIADVNRRFGITVLIITHEMQVVREICQRVSVMDQGHIVEQGAVSDIAVRPESEVARRFLGLAEGAGLPAWLAARLQPQPRPGALQVLRLGFSGQTALEPVLSRIARSEGADINVLGGRIDPLIDGVIGALIVGVAGAPLLAQRVIEKLENDNVAVESLGYLA